MKQRIAISMSCLAAVTIVGASGAASAATKISELPHSVIQAKFTLAQNVKTPMAQTVSYFDNLVKKYTGGEIQITLYPNNQLGTQTAQLEGVENNTIQFQATGGGLDSIVPSFDVTALPFLFSSASKAQIVLDNGSLNKVLWNHFDATGLHYIGMWDVGFSDVLSKTPITGPSSYRGLTIRVFDAALGGPEFKLVGADAVNVSANDVVTALATGAINAADDPPSTFYASNWYSEAHDVAIANMTYAGDPLMVSEVFWKSLSKAEQKDMVRAYNATVAFNIKQSTSFNNNAVTNMKAAGITVTHPNIAALKKAFKPVWGNFKVKYPAVTKILLKEVNKVG